MSSFNFWTYFIVLIGAITTGAEKYKNPKAAKGKDYAAQVVISTILLILLVKYK